MRNQPIFFLLFCPRRGRERSKTIFFSYTLKGVSVCVSVRAVICLLYIETLEKKIHLCLCEKKSQATIKKTFVYLTKPSINLLSLYASNTQTSLNKPLLILPYIVTSLVDPSLHCDITDLLLFNKTFGFVRLTLFLLMMILLGQTAITNKNFVFLLLSNKTFNKRKEKTLLLTSLSVMSCLNKSSICFRFVTDLSQFC